MKNNVDNIIRLYSTNVKDNLIFSIDDYYFEKYNDIIYDHVSNYFYNNEKYFEIITKQIDINMKNKKFILFFINKYINDIIRKNIKDIDLNIMIKKIIEIIEKED